MSDMVERVTRKNENRESELPLTISAQYGLIDQNEFFDKRIASRDVSGYYLLKKGEFAYNKSTSSDAPWGAVKRLDRYEMGVLSTLYIVFALKENGNIDSDFLVSYYDTDCWHKGVQAIAAEGARNHGLLNITPADYFETVLTVPSDVKEQHQIGSFFAKLDTLITLHQRKYDKLTKVKKAMLEKMFPENGSPYPEIRFKGFTDAWEQRKLSDTLNFLSNNTLSRAELSEDTGTYKNVHYGDVLVKFGEYIDAQSTDLPYIADDEKAKKFESSKLQDGDIIIADTAEDEAVGKCVEIGNIGDLSIVSGLHTIPCRSKVKFAPAYLGFYLNSSSYHDQLIPLMQGIKVTSISKSAISDTLISAPTDLSEQGKIGQFFSQLDTLITLHQRM